MYQKKYLFLLNDVLLVTTVQTTAGSVMMKSKEKYEIQDILYLDKICVNNLNYLEPHEATAFEISHEDGRIYEFLTESESEKRIWVEKIIQSIHCTLKASGAELSPGWHHRIAQGSLHSAAILDHMDRVNFHLSKLAGKSPDIADELGMCPIHWAALAGNRSIVVALLDNGSHIDVLNNGLNSPLLLAASQGHEMVVNTLLERGADAFIRNLKDRDALFMSALYAPNAKGLAKIFMFLHFRGVDLNRLDSTGSAPLHECAARNLSRPVRLLVDAGAEVNNKQGRSGVTPLQVACCNSKPDVETIRTLLEKGAYPNWRDNENMTAFEHVLRKNLVRCPCDFIRCLIFL
jgi:ankyrin repeat protein